MARSRSQSCRLRKGCVKLFFFALTFIVFVVLQYLLQFVGPAWKTIQQETAGIPGLILFLACLGVVPVVWVVLLGVDEVLQRVCESRQNPYGNVSSDEDSDDVETGSKYQVNYTKDTKKKKPKKSSTMKSSQERSPARKSNQCENDEDARGTPTDVDVSVHPVDTTIAAGGEARVSPYYNVSLMNFANDSPSCPRNEATNRLFPSAPMMLGGPALFKREF